MSFSRLSRCTCRTGNGGLKCLSSSDGSSRGLALHPAAVGARAGIRVGEVGADADPGAARGTAQGLARRVGAGLIGPRCCALAGLVVVEDLHHLVGPQVQRGARLRPGVAVLAPEPFGPPAGPSVVTRRSHGYQCASGSHASHGLAYPLQSQCLREAYLGLVSARTLPGMPAVPPGRPPGAAGRRPGRTRPCPGLPTGRPSLGGCPGTMPRTPG